MKKIFFIIIFVSLLFSECLSKKYSKKKKTKPLKNPPPYADRFSIIYVYVKKEHRPKVKAILDDISKRSCLDFYLPYKKISSKSGINIYETSESNSLKISYSKRTPTTLKLNKDTFKNTAKLAFQIGRALGMIPEISRPDRDYYVKINWENIKSSIKKYYEKTTYNYSYYPGVQFDFGSIMLFDPLYGSNNGKSTYTYNRYAFQSEEESQKIYDPNRIFSHNDVKFLNGMYCRKKCKNYCKNGGFPGKSCKSCVCPFHFEGQKCEIPRKSTGDCLQTNEYIATYDLKLIQYKGKTGKCNYHFKSDSQENNITVSFTNIKFSNSKCTRNDSYMDITYRNDRGTTGVTICKSMKALMIPPVSGEIFLYIHALKPEDSMAINYYKYRGYNSPPDPDYELPL